VEKFVICLCLHTLVCLPSTNWPIYLLLKTWRDFHTLLLLLHSIVRVKGVLILLLIVSCWICVLLRLCARESVGALCMNRPLAQLYLKKWWWPVASPGFVVSGGHDDRGAEWSGVWGGVSAPQPTRGTEGASWAPLAAAASVQIYFGGRSRSRRRGG